MLAEDHRFTHCNLMTPPSAGDGLVVGFLGQTYYLRTNYWFISWFKLISNPTAKLVSKPIVWSHKKSIEGETASQSVGVDI